ncbi:MAG: hypothetical protein ACI4FX_02940 [Agathobacter sp.]
MAVRVPKIYSHEYVCCLPLALEKRVMAEVRKEISTLLLSDEEKIEAIGNAAHSKVCDLTDTINIIWCH